MRSSTVSSVCTPRSVLAHLHGNRATTTLFSVILRFADKATKDVYDGTDSKDARSIPKTIWRSARNKLDMLNAAHELKDLSAARLEKLRANWAGFWSIRVNDQYRIVFSFAAGNADEVRIVDYH